MGDVDMRAELKKREEDDIRLKSQIHHAVFAEVTIVPGFTLRVNWLIGHIT